MKKLPFFNSEVNAVQVAKQRLLVFKIMSYTAIVASLATAYQYYFLLNEKNIVPKYSLALSVFLLLNLQLLKWHKIKIFSYSAALFSTFLIIHITTYYTGGIVNAGLYYYSALIIGSFFLLGITWGGYSTIIALLDITYFYYIDPKKIQHFIPPDLLPLDAYITLMFSFIVVTLFTFGLEWTKNSAIKTISVTNDLLRSSYAEIEKFSTVLSQTDNSVMITDKLGKIEWVNDGFEKLTGYNLTDVKGTFGEILRKGEKTGLSDSNVFKKCIVEKKTIYYVEKNYHQNGKEYWAATTLSPIFDEDGKLQNLVAIDTDMTERKALEVELLRAITVAEESVNNQRELMNVLSNEIRRPLNHMVDLTESLSASTLNEAQHTMVQTLRMSAKTLDLTIGDVLEYAKMKSKNEFGNFSNFQILSMCEEIIQNFENEASKKGINLVFNTNFEKQDIIESDPGVLEQILTNFLTTAISFTNKGTIEIQAIKEISANNSVQIYFNFLNIAIGESEENKEKLIQSFTKYKGKDSDFLALGIEISLKLIKAVQGSVAYQKLDNDSLEISFNFNAKHIPNLTKQVL